MSWLESQNYAPNYIEGILKSVKSWLIFNYVEPKRKIRITNAKIPVNIQDDLNLPNDIRESYSQLKERAEKNSSVQTSLFVPQENIDTIKGMLVQIKNQGDYFKMIFDEVKEENSLMKISSKKKDEQIAKLSKTVTDIENSIMWKMLKV